MRLLSLFLRNGMQQLQTLSCCENPTLKLVTQLLHSIHEKFLVPDKCRICVTDVLSYPKIS